MENVVSKKFGKGVIFHLFLLLLLLFFICSTLYSWEGLNEVLYFHSAELFNSTSLQINFVYLAVSLSLPGAVV